MNKRKIHRRPEIFFVVLVVAIGLMEVASNALSDTIWKYDNSTERVLTNETYNRTTIYLSQNLTMGYIDTDGDGTADAPATLLLDAPAVARAEGQSGYLNYECNETADSNSLVFESKDSLMSNILQMDAKVNAGYCDGTPTCIRQICGAAACGTGCIPQTFGCTKGTRKCTSFGGCSQYLSQLQCNGVPGCNWIGGVIKYSSYQYSDDNTTAEFYTDDATNATTYFDGSYHINLTGTSGSSENYITDVGTLVMDEGFETLSGYFDVDDTNGLLWYDNTAGIWVYPADGTYLYGNVYANDIQGISGTFIVQNGTNFTDNTTTTCDFTFEQGIMVGSTC